MKRSRFDTSKLRPSGAHSMMPAWSLPFIISNNFFRKVGTDSFFLLFFLSILVKFILDALVIRGYCVQCMYYYI